MAATLQLSDVSLPLRRFIKTGLDHYQENFKKRQPWATQSIDCVRHEALSVALGLEPVPYFHPALRQVIRNLRREDWYPLAPLVATGLIQFDELDPIGITCRLKDEADFSGYGGHLSGCLGAIFGDHYYKMGWTHQQTKLLIALNGGGYLRADHIWTDMHIERHLDNKAIVEPELPKVQESVISTLLSNGALTFVHPTLH